MWGVGRIDQPGRFGPRHAVLDQRVDSGANITVTPTNPEDAGFGEPVTVTVDIDFSQVSWLPSPMYLGGTTLSATTVMRRERVQ